jgi:hypothetical protein
VSRLPAKPDRADLPEAERADYDFVMSVFGEPPHPEAASRPYFEATISEMRFQHALANTPSTNAALLRAAFAFVETRGRPGRWTARDHFFMDCVIDADVGLWGFMTNHVPMALAEGVRLEALEALVEGDDDRLTEDERRQARYIRAVIHGQVTDELWNGLVDALGSVRGAIEYTMFVGLVLGLERMAQALGVAAHTRDDVRQQIEDLRPGTVTAS